MFAFVRRLVNRIRPADATMRSARDPELDARLAEIMTMLAPPTERRSAPAWDEFWARHVAHGIPWVSDMMVRDEELVALIRTEGLRRVLIAGNGVSREPHALAAAGLDVVAVDISPAATEFARRLRFEDGDGNLDFMIGENNARPGGTVEHVAGDVFDPALCVGPFDVCIERRTAQNYPEDERAAFLAALASRLSSQGIFVSHCHDNRWRPGREYQHATKGWFEAQGWPVVHGFPATKVGGRLACLFTSSG